MISTEGIMKTSPGFADLKDKIKSLDLGQRGLLQVFCSRDHHLLRVRQKKGMKNCLRKKVHFILKVKWAICEMCVLLSCALGLPKFFFNPKLDSIFWSKMLSHTSFGVDRGRQVRVKTRPTKFGIFTLEIAVFSAKKTRILWPGKSPYPSHESPKIGVGSHIDPND